ncbi:MAG TPA: hypothetical protein VFF31_05710 [Blastocatellia bacterium]|nr:hypothetical protein [Blastocatellia bacterium]
MKGSLIGRELFAQAALAQIPHILTLLDRNPHSPSYGCFDRNYWHYRTIDFPSGMAQEFVLPLALAYELELPDNPYYHQLSLRQWIEAGMLYAARSAHRDGSCDDYYPYERAAGAAAFSLLACVQSCALLQLNNQDIFSFLRRRANWLAGHHESGRLSNHQALIALSLELLSHLLRTDEWDKARDLRLDRVLSWQSAEGWFQEYEGCDPGYHTLTLSCLAWLYILRPSPKLKEAVIRAVRVADEFIHPDGSYGGEYGSRNTYNFFPHGFELAGKWLPEALSVNDKFLAGLNDGIGPCYDDDHIIGHHTWNYLLAWRDYVRERPRLEKRPSGRVVLKDAGILIDRRHDTELYVALKKGGVFKLFRDQALIASDTHLSLKVRSGGKIKNAVGHLVGDYQTDVSDDEITISGTLGWAKQQFMTTARLVALRFAMAAFGRFFPDLIRKLLQRKLITGKSDAPFQFTRTLKWEGGWRVVDQLRARSWQNVVAAGIGGDQTSIYVVMSRTFQAGQLSAWLDLTEEIKKLTAGEPLELVRKF